MLISIESQDCPSPLYVIAINCLRSETISFMVGKLQTRSIECVDVLAYDAVKDFKFYFDSVDVRERLPLLFIFPGEEFHLVREYSELADVQKHLAA